MVKTAGIIAEYNPFHRGHRYHIEKTRQLSGAQAVVAVMSGDFVQRGDPAVFDKYLRTKMALEQGVDVVIELPVTFATSSAMDFAFAGISLLDRLGVIDYLSFGSEYASEEELIEIATLLQEEPEEYRVRLAQALKSGKNYPAARQESVEKILGKEKAEILSHPNHILGVAYIRGLLARKSPIRPCAVLRKGKGYHEKNGGSGYASAAGIRQMLRSGQITEGEYCWEEDIRKKICLEMGNKEGIRAYEQKATVSWEDMMPALSYELLFREQDLSVYQGIHPDMAARIRKAVENGDDIEELIARVHCRSFTDTAFRRAFLHILLHIFKEESKEVPYARILGFSETGRELLKKMKETSEIPLIQHPARAEELLRGDSRALELWKRDMKSEQYYEQLVEKKGGRKAIHPMRRRQIYHKKEITPSLL